MEREADVYRRLQQHLDTMPVGFPATESGVELRILRRLFTPEEAEIALCLSAIPEPLEKIHSRAPGQPREEVGRALDRLAAKGAIFATGSPGDARRYGKAPLAIGMYEMQVDRLTRELQEDFERYSREAFGQAFLGPKTKQMRTIPVNARFVPDRMVGRYDDARALIEKGHGPWAVLNCVCRQGKDLVGEPCRQTQVRRTCLTVGRMAQGTIASGVGEALSRAEVLGLLDRAEREGMVLQPSNTQEPVFMCFCCGCCCGVLTIAKRFPRPAEYLHSNYQAVVDPEQCTACETCRSRCPMEALHAAEGATAVDLERCIGCGLCVSTCPTGAVGLVKKAKETVPPRDLRALYGRIAVDRFGLLGAATKVARALLGRPI